MYKTIVARKVRQAWAALNTRDYGPVVRSFAPRFRYENIAAEHELGGTFTTADEMADHFDRLFHLFPDVRFAVRDVLVSGWPGSTSVVIHVGLTATLPDGKPYENEIVQRMSLRWGKVTEARALIDNVRARTALETLAREGVLTGEGAPSGRSS